MKDGELPCEQPGGLEQKLGEGKWRGGSGLLIAWAARRKWQGIAGIKRGGVISGEAKISDGGRWKGDVTQTWCRR